MKDVIRIDGLSDLRRELAKLPDAVSEGVILRVLRKRGTPIADRAAALAPVDHGDLKKSIVVSVKLTSRQAGLHRKDGPDDVEVFIGPSDLPQAHLKEFGTSDSAPQPFMRPAWDASKAGLIDELSADIWAEIVRVIGSRVGDAGE